MGKNINIKELLQNYYFGNVINTINNYYSNSSVMEIFGIERLEVAVSESKDKMISEEDKEVAQAFANSEDEVRISGKRNKYNVFYPGNTNNQPLTMRDVVAEFVWFLLKTKKLSILDINNQIKNMVGKVASTTDIVKESDKQDKNSRYVIYERDGKSFYVHRDWTL